ncbi:MAG: hypothetical protein ACT4OO_10525 [Nitrospiraceae bacterium]
MTTSIPTTRQWISYLCESLVSSGSMPTWDAVAYLTENLFGDQPNSRLLDTKNPYQLTSQFLHRLYSPLVEAASRDIALPASSMIHIFTDISLTGKSAVLVVYFPGHNRPHHLLLLDAIRAWDVVFPHCEAFNMWAEERYRWIRSALATAISSTESLHTALTGTTAALNF